MLKRQTRPAQGFIENPLRHPHRQSREAGSCLGADRQPALASRMAIMQLFQRQPALMPAIGAATKNSDILETGSEQLRCRTH